MRWSCPSCGKVNALTFRGGGHQEVGYFCPVCLPQRVTIGRNLPGLPSDVTYLREHGPGLLRDAYERLRDLITARRQARDRAETLLMAHLDAHQQRLYSSSRYFHVASTHAAELRYRISVTEVKAQATALSPVVFHPLEGFVQSMRSLPGIGPRIRDAAIEEFRQRACVPLCLIVMGPVLPPADAALALKLFLETDETRAWIKGSRAHLGLNPEPLIFQPIEPPVTARPHN